MNYYYYSDCRFAAWWGYFTGLWRDYPPLESNEPQRPNILDAISLISCRIHLHLRIWLLTCKLFIWWVVHSIYFTFKFLRNNLPMIAFALITKMLNEILSKTCVTQLFSRISLRCCVTLISRSLYYVFSQFFHIWYFGLTFTVGFSSWKFSFIILIKGDEVDNGSQ